MGKSKTAPKKKAVKKTRSIIIPAKYVRAVEEGVKFLDLMFGRKEWLKRMDMTDFEIENPNTCVAGNVFKDSMFGVNDSGYRSFIDGVRALGVSGFDTAKRFGFDVETTSGGQHLQDLWVRKIKAFKRQAALK